VLELGRPLLQTHPVAPLAEIAPGLSARKTAIAAPADVPAVIDDEREAADAGGAARRQILEGGDPVASVGARLHHHLARAERAGEADAALEGPRRSDGGSAHRALRLGVEHQTVEGAQHIPGSQRIGAIGKRGPVDDGRAAQERDQQRECPSEARASGALIDGFLRSCYWLRHGVRVG
jgi:hypothetical protein